MYQQLKNSAKGGTNETKAKKKNIRRVKKHQLKRRGLTKRHGWMNAEWVGGPLIPFSTNITATIGDINAIRNMSEARKEGKKTSFLLLTTITVQT